MTHNGGTPEDVLEKGDFPHGSQLSPCSSGAGLQPSLAAQRPGFCTKSLKGLRTCLRVLSSISWKGRSGIAQSFVYLLVPSAHPAVTVPATNLSTRTTQTTSATQNCHNERSPESRLLKNWFLFRSRELANLTSETGQTSPTPLNINIRGDLITETSGTVSLTSLLSASAQVLGWVAPYLC